MVSSSRSGRKSPGPPKFGMRLIPKARGVPSALDQRHQVPCLIAPVEHGCKTPALPTPRQKELAQQESPIAGVSRHATRGRGRAQHSRCSCVPQAVRKYLFSLALSQTETVLCSDSLASAFKRSACSSGRQTWITDVLRGFLSVGDRPAINLRLVLAL